MTVQLWELKGWRGRRPLGGRWVLRSNCSDSAHKAPGKREIEQSPSSLGSWMLWAPLPDLTIKKESKFTYYNLFKQAASQTISILSFQIQGLALFHTLRGLPGSIPDIWTHTGTLPSVPLEWSSLSFRTEAIPGLPPPHWPCLWTSFAKPSFSHWTLDVRVPVGPHLYLLSSLLPVFPRCFMEFCGFDYRLRASPKSSPALG